MKITLYYFEAIANLQDYNEVTNAGRVFRKSSFSQCHSAETSRWMSCVAVMARCVWILSSHRNSNVFLLLPML